VNKDYYSAGHLTLYTRHAFVVDYVLAFDGKLLPETSLYPITGHVDHLFYSGQTNYDCPNLVNHRRSLERTEHCRQRVSADRS